jgi:hypothetical protein
MGAKGALVEKLQDGVTAPVQPPALRGVEEAVGPS